jgi:hypothetical protein
MAVVTIYSTQLVNVNATPPQYSGSYMTGGMDWTATDICAMGATDSAGSTYRFCRLPSNALILDVKVMNDANTAGTSYKCGVYTIGGGGPAVTNADVIFFSGVTMASARNVWTSLFFPSVLNAGGLVANATKRVWELLGLNSDSGLLYDVAVAAVTAGTAGGNLALSVNWTR